MKVRILLLLCIIPLLMSCKEEIIADKSFIENVAKHYSEQSSISYKIKYKMKYIESDTVTLTSSVNLLRISTDTIFSGYIWIDTMTSPNGEYSKYYDGRFLYLIDKEKNELTRFDSKKDETFIMTGGDSYVKNVYFLKPEKLKEVLNDSSLQVKIKDTVIDEKKYALVNIKHPDDDEFKNRQKNIYINKQTKNIEKITYYASYGDDFEYQELQLSDISFNKVTKQDLEEKIFKLKKGLPSKDFKPLTEEETAPLMNGITAPDFLFTSYHNSTPLKLSDYKGKLIILDFWYMSCPPCTMTIPELNKLYEKYSDEIVILGVNPYDITGTKLKLIPAFIKKHHINYTLGTIDEDVMKQYNIHGFPTVYVIDRSGRIQFSHVGYNKEFYTQMDIKIKHLLK